MARFVKLSKRWINLDLVGSADDDGDTIRLNADLDQGTGRISRGFSGEDAAVLRAVLNVLSVNVASTATARALTDEELNRLVAMAEAARINGAPPPSTAETEARG